MREEPQSEEIVQKFIELILKHFHRIPDDLRTQETVTILRFIDVFRAPLRWESNYHSDDEDDKTLNACSEAFIQEAKTLLEAPFDQLLALVEHDQKVHQKILELQASCPKGLDLYMQRIHENPLNASHHYRRAKAYASQGHDEEALKDFSHAVLLNQYHTDAYFRRGELYGHMKDYLKAAEDYKKTITLNPEYGNGLAALSLQDARWRYYLQKKNASKISFFKVKDSSENGTADFSLDAFVLIKNVIKAAMIEKSDAYVANNIQKFCNSKVPNFLGLTGAGRLRETARYFINNHQFSMGVLKWYLLQGLEAAQKDRDAFNVALTTNKLG